MESGTAKSVEEYIARAPKEAQSALRELRALLRASAPDVDESISWGVPFYRCGGALGGYAAYKNHVSFGCSSELDGKDRDTLEKSGYKTGKKTIQIRFDQEVPAAAIAKILKAEARANEAKGATPFAGGGE